MIDKHVSKEHSTVLLMNVTRTIKVGESKTVHIHTNDLIEMIQSTELTGMDL